MKKLWDEFKAFAFKGNMIDLAVGVVIGAAFGTVIKSLVDNIMMSIVSYVAPATSYTQWHIGKVLVGKFLGDIVSFLTIAAAVFFVIVKIAGYLARRAVPPAEPTTKTCPLCLSVIPLSARKCSHCTANLEQDARALGASV